MKNGKKMKGAPSIMIAVAIPSRQAKSKADERKKKMEEAAEMKKEKMEMKAYESMVKVAKGAKAKPKAKKK
jgi:hypothetical protein